MGGDKVTRLIEEYVWKNVTLISSQSGTKSRGRPYPLLPILFPILSVKLYFSVPVTKFHLSKRTTDFCKDGIFGRDNAWSTVRSS